MAGGSRRHPCRSPPLSPVPDRRCLRCAIAYVGPIQAAPQSARSCRAPARSPLLPPRHRPLPAPSIPGGSPGCPAGPKPDPDEPKDPGAPEPRILPFFMPPARQSAQGHVRAECADRHWPAGIESTRRDLTGHGPCRSHSGQIDAATTFVGRKFRSVQIAVSPVPRPVHDRLAACTSETAAARPRRPASAARSGRRSSGGVRAILPPARHDSSDCLTEIQA